MLADVKTSTVLRQFDASCTHFVAERTFERKRFPKQILVCQDFVEAALSLLNNSTGSAISGEADEKAEDYFKCCHGENGRGGRCYAKYSFAGIPL